MTALLALLALVGQPAALWTDAGVCTGVVAGPGVVVFDAGTCRFDDTDALLYVGDDPEEAAGTVIASEWTSGGRVVVRFEGGL